MSNQTAETPTEATDPAPKKSRGGLLRVVKPMAFIGVIVMVEVVAAAMLLPSSKDTEKLAKEFVAASEGHSGDHADDLKHAEHAGQSGHNDGHDVREVELGIFNVTRFNPKTNTTLAIDFELYAVVLASDATEFEHLYENSKARLREQVVMTLHSATSADLVESGLGLIKRRILEKTNRAVGEPLVREVVFSKFNFVER